jgi:signal peptidase II
LRPQYPVHDRGSRRRAIVLASAAVAVALAVGIDQLTKWWALQVFRDGRVVDLLPSVTLRLVFNPGAAFGMGQVRAPHW